MKKILLVEDTADLLLNITDTLRMEGYAVKGAVNGTIALQILENYTPHLIITDLRMPGLDGLAFINAVKTNDHYSDIPILIYSARITPDDEAAGLQLGAVQYLKKPCPIDFFIETVFNLINKKDTLAT